MIDTENVEKAKKLIKAEKKPIIVIAKDDDFNRKILEYGKFDVLLNVENGQRKNTLRDIDSGFNHVLASIAAKKEIALGIDIGKIRENDKKGKAEILMKIRQNIKVCRKKKVEILAFNYKDKKDAFSLLASLGASSEQAKKAIYF